MKTLFEFEDGESVTLELIQEYIEPRQINLLPRRKNRMYPVELETLKKEFKQGVYPKRGYLQAIFKDEMGEEWMQVYIAELDQERLFNLSFWGWN